MDYEYAMGENRFMNLPITPWCCITLARKQSINQFAKSGIIPLFRIDKSEDIEFFNKQAYQMEKEDNKKYILSNNRNILENFRGNYHGT